jgi:glycosyltransferase involved in cell wall biosynthesis
MKIAIIGHKGIAGNGGGVESHVRDLAVSLAKRGHSVTSFSGSDKVKEYEGVKIVRVFTIRLKNLEAAIRTFISACLTVLLKFDLIHVHSIGPGSFIPLIKLLNPRTPIVFTFHCQDYYHQKWGLVARSYLKLGEKIACQYADAIVAISKDIVPYVKKSYGREAVYISNATGKKDYVPAQIISEKWNLERNSYIASVSRLVRHKGIHILIAAFKQMDTEKKLVIVGDSAYTDDYVRELKSLAADDPRIIFTGAQSGKALAELYANAALFVQPSGSEGLSIALLEAMSYSLPCLVSNIPANLEAVGNEGMSFASGSVEDLKNKMEDILSDPELLAKLVAVSKERIDSEYNLDIFIDKHEKMCLSVVENR